MEIGLIQNTEKRINSVQQHLIVLNNACACAAKNAPVSSKLPP
jgi:hypothetical protein